MKKLMLPCLVIVMGLALTVSTRAGDLEPSWGPQSGSGMYNLSEVYYYLTEGREGSIADSFQEPTAGPGSTMMDTKVIYEDVKAEFDGCDAEPGDVLSGTTFFNTDTSAWGVQSGTVETRSLSSQTDAVDGGYYAATTLSTVDNNLATANIKQGMEIFGISGDPNVADTSDADAVPGDILATKTAYVTGSKITGNIVTMTSFTGAEGAITFAVPGGYYDGTATSTATDDALLVGNIKEGVDIFGTTGTFPSDGTAAVGEVKSGSTFYAVSGTIKTGSGTKALSAGSETVAAGYYEATTLSGVDSELATGNIRQGANIFGIPGDPNVADTTTGDAVAGNILSTKVAWVDGSEVTGTIETRTLSAASDTVDAGFYAQTTLSSVDSDLATANIKQGVTIFGKAGDPNVADTSGGTAGEWTVFSDQVAWANGSMITGRVETRSWTSSTTAYDAGFYAQTELNVVDSDLETGNIKQGMEIFGILGKPEVADTSTGDAVAGDILDTKVAWVDGSEVTGNIATMASFTGAEGEITFGVPSGYYDGATSTAEDNELAAGNIKDGVDIFGTTGTFPSDGDALVGEVKTGRYFYTDSSARLTGNGTETLSPANDTVDAGFYEQTTLNGVDNDLVTANIKQGIEIFGISGDPEVADTGSGTATAADIKDSKVAWVDGSEVTGTIETQTWTSSTTAYDVGFYAETDLNVVDTDLATGNIRQGMDIFGIAGNPNVADTSTGDAVAGDILDTKVAWVDGSEVTGNIATMASFTGAEGAITFGVPGGYYDGATSTAEDNELAAGNIKDGVEIFGTTGTFPSDGTAAETQVKTGSTFYAGSGTIKTGSGTKALSPISETVTAGYYEATTLSTVDSELATANIKQGIDIFGIDGDPNVADTGSGDAVAGDMLSGKIAWVTGSEVTGTIVTQTWTSSTTAYDAGFYAETDLNVVDTDLATGNIRQGMDIFGIAGNPNVADTSTGDAVAGDILDTKVAWVDGSSVTGSIATMASFTGAEGAITFNVPGGYYDGATSTAEDNELAAGNIKDGVDIFGTMGTFPSDGDALADEVKSGKFFYTNTAAKLTGSGTQTLSADNDTVTAGYYEATTLSTVDSALQTANIKQGIDIFGIDGDPNVADTGSGDAVAGDMLSGKIAWVTGSEVTGTIETRTLSADNDTVDVGFYAQTTLSDVDRDLVTGNIKQGVTVFGIDGDPNVADTTTGDAAAGDILSLKVAWVDGSEVTGTIETRTFSADTSVVEAGYYAQTDLSVVDIDLTAENIKKDVAILGVDGTLYVGNLLKTGDIEDGKFGEAFSCQTAVYGGGIVTIDNVTGLMWASYGDQTGCNFGNQTDWSLAIDWADNLSFAEYSDWRMPNTTEINSIVNRGNCDPAINATYFPNTQSDEYWSSTTFKADTGNAWFVNFTDGNVSNAVKTDSYYVRPVRGGIPPTWYEIYGPDGTDEVVQIGTMYVAKWKEQTGCALDGTKNWASACSWGTDLDWLGKTDWRLPTGNTGGELSTICTNKESLGSYQSVYYWSSTEDDAVYAWYVYFDNCYVGYRDKASNGYVRAVRSSE